MSWTFHHIQLLHLHYDLYVFDFLLCGTFGNAWCDEQERLFLLQYCNLAFFFVGRRNFGNGTIARKFFALKATASGTFNFPQVYVAYFSIIDMVARHMPGVETEIGLDHWPKYLLWCGNLLIYLLYLMNKKISLKEKVVYFTMSLFFLASFAIDVLNYIWHGFHYPNSLPARQSFIYIFLVLFMAFRAYDRFRANTLKELVWRQWEA